MYKIGFGEDIHHLKNGLGFYLGGVFIKDKFAIIAESDGDVVIHSICDAILGALALGDIGKYFKKNDSLEKLKGLNILNFCKEIINQHKFIISNLDITLIYDHQYLSKYRLKIITSIANSLTISLDKISIKFTCSENLHPNFIISKSIILLAKDSKY